MVDDSKMREIRYRMGQAEDAIDAVHGSLAHEPELDSEWRDEFCTDLVVMRTKLQAIAGVLTEPATGCGEQDALVERRESGSPEHLRARPPRS
jgi:hypothetical protein